MTVAIDAGRASTLATALLQLGTEIEALGAELCGDPDLIARHCDTLQQFDLIVQKQQAIAALLRAECLPCAIGALEIDQFRQELQAAETGPGCTCN